MNFCYLSHGAGDILLWKPQDISNQFGLKITLVFLLGDKEWQGIQSLYLVSHRTRLRQPQPSGFQKTLNPHNRSQHVNLDFTKRSNVLPVES